MERLIVEDLNFYYGFNQILNQISFEVKKGEIVGIVGPSGGGKTTLLKLCGALEDYGEGQIHNGFASSAFAFQDARLLPWKTVLENIMLPVVAKEGYKQAVKKATAYALRFGLEEKDFDKYPKDLSGGMRQRVNFARALIAKPSLLFLDEPFSALDIGLKKELQNYVIDSNKKEDTSVLFITHDLMEAIKLSDKILLLKSDPGEIVKTYEINENQQKRDDAFVFEKTKAFLNDTDVLNTFEIKVS
jgi:NitT/TauT family transport system ATP-binding protein